MSEAVQPSTTFAPTRRAALHLLLAGGSAALLAACSPSPTRPTPPQSTGQPAMAEQPKRGGRLTTSALPLARVDAHCFCGGDALLGIWDTAIDYDQNL